MSCQKQIPYLEKESCMKRTILVLATVALLAFAGSAWAQGVNFVSFKEGAAESDFITIDWVLPQSIFVGDSQFPSPNPRAKISQEEFAEVVFYLQGTLPLQNVGDTYTTLMVEPDGLTPSDSAVLKLIEKPANNLAIFDLVFHSDGSPGFEPVEPARIVTEDGTLQEIINLPGFAVLAQSDVDVAPIPGSLLMLGTGILGIVGGGLRRKSA
jgi:hypothetical protein